MPTFLQRSWPGYGSTCLLRIPVFSPDGSWRAALTGTIDSWVIWNLSGRSLPITGDSNAGRTLLYNLQEHHWDPTLWERFGIPRHWLPEIHPSIGRVGCTAPDLLGAEVQIAAILGDQQAALLAHGCDRPGLMNGGDEINRSSGASQSTPSAPGQNGCRTGRQ